MGKIKNTLLAMLLCMLATGCNAQGNNNKRTLNDSLLTVVIDSSYNFINYDTNILIIPGDSTQMLTFAKKWYKVLSTGKGHVSIAQIGASHVQGGTFPHRIRRNILLGAIRATGDTSLVSERGMIFPYSAATKCNNPFDYKVSRSHALTLTRNVYKEPLARLGLCGIAVTASDSTAVIGVTLNEPDIRFETNRIILLGHSPDSILPQILLRDTYDSILLLPTKVVPEHGQFIFQTPRIVDSFKVIIPCDSGQSFTLTGIFMGNDRPVRGITYHSIGVNGAAVSDYLDKCPDFTRDLKMIHPDLVIFGIGINDATGPNFDSTIFRRRYLQLVDSIRKDNPDCAFIFVTNNDSYRKAGRKKVPNQNGLLAHDAFMRIAADCGGAVWDQFVVMGGYNSINKWYSSDLAQKDKVHFTRKGYELLGDLFSNALFNTLRQLRPVTHEQEFPAADSALPAATPTQPAEKNSNPKALYPKKKNKRIKNSDNSADVRPNYISY